VSQLDSVEFRAVALREQPDFLSHAGNLSDGGWDGQRKWSEFFWWEETRENFSNLNRL